MPRFISANRRRSVGWFVASCASMALVTSCVVSFSGYELAETDVDGGPATAGSAGSTSSGGGAGPAGGTAGAEGTAGLGTTLGGAAGNAGLGGTGGAGNGGSGPGGRAGSDAGMLDASAGSGGLTGGTSGSAGASGAGGTGGAAGSAGAGGATAGRAGMDGGGGSGMAGSKDAGSDGASTTGCPLLPGPQLVEVPIPAGASGAPGTYCVDQTEVTSQQYAAFLATNPSLGSQPALCAWNTDFSPTAMASPENCPNLGNAYDPVARPNYPVSCIDWCDADAYCKSVGKHLCRSFAGTDVTASKTADATSDEWYAACSAGGTQRYAYGNTYQGSFCNMDLFGAPRSVGVGIAASCHGASPPYLYLSDMNGNVAEWQSACSGETGMADTCASRGGSWLSSNSSNPAIAGDCVAAPTSLRSRRSQQIGFRCCYDRK